ncbi:hypothetical protein MSMTP_0455 [Methanosarcina sp. MTP4]|uniref:hypothetical protein n=1 Tax=Methanosarcina sp. MTP4 TaxID=1434100 RepID=UPI000616039D|nr:hypothetical protein [Methanosarcina sp. MTP4]AKB23924.1 hypothetical protein MSMTP_0455 [Methanosarcina sp. MTP4]
MGEDANTKKILLAVLILAVVLSSFFVLDFKAAKSETRANSRIAAYSTGEPQIDFPGRIYLYVEGDEALSGFVREKIRAELEKAGMDVEDSESFEEKYDSQALLVNVRESEGMYTPIYASSNLEIMYFYTSTGEDTIYFEKFKEGNVTVRFVNTGSQEGEKMADGKLELQDSTKGIVSRKAYRKHLAEEAAKNVVDQLQNQIRDIP